MKIVYLTSFFPPDRIAGAELGTYFMARHMAQRGHDVHVLISRPVQNKTRTEKRDGFTIHWHAYLDRPGLRFYSEVKAATQKIKELNPSLIHANCLLPGGYSAVIAKSKLNIPCIVLCYGYDVCDISFPLTWLGSKVFKKCSKLLSATEYCRDVIRQFNQNLDATVFYAGFNDDAFPLQDYRPVRDDKVQLLFMGRLIAEKGFELMISVMEQLPAIFELTVVGDGELKAKYEQYMERSPLQGRVTFLGQVENNKIKEIFKGTDALVLPSHREPFGVVCIEAIASGVPVVCSDVMGLPEAVAHERNGLVITGRSVKHWVDAIQTVTLNDERKRAIYECAREDRKKWNWSTRLGELEKIYDTVVAEHSCNSLPR